VNFSQLQFTNQVKMSFPSRIPSLAAFARREGFHAKYLALCKAKTIVSLTEVKAKNNNMAVLDFYDDRLRPHDWQIITKALSTDTSLKIVRIRLRRNDGFGKEYHW
jgi:hypothetical protein